jgi:1,4-alpha-glucan branching enzyme
LFLQNHDQVGNRAFGERLTALAEPAALEAAIALQLLCPQIPLIFMGEECASRTPFLFFTDHNDRLAEAVREGRRGEFAGFAGFPNPKRLAEIPDPNAIATFEASVPEKNPEHGAERGGLYRRLLALRRTEVVPRLPGARALGARTIGPAAVVARWRMGDGAVLTLASNLGQLHVHLGPVDGCLLFASSRAAEAMARAGQLAARTTVALLETRP